MGRNMPCAGSAARKKAFSLCHGAGRALFPDPGAASGGRTGAPHAERGGSMMSGTAPGRIDELFSEVDGGVPAMQPENAA